MAITVVHLQWASPSVAEALAEGSWSARSSGETCVATTDWPFLTLELTEQVGEFSLVQKDGHLLKL